MSQRHGARGAPRYGRIRDINQDFRCINCGTMVPSSYAVAGVRNRNHCPYCLWSRHLDWREAGDRLSACRAPMRPVGLTVHQCARCGALDINRIAADDDAIGLMLVFDESATFGILNRDALLDQQITLLRHDAAALVRQRLGVMEEFAY
jgi:DNA-directed RNA polymerase subunit RPC12/RpoP